MRNEWRKGLLCIRNSPFFCYEPYIFSQSYLNCKKYVKIQ